MSKQPNKTPAKPDLRGIEVTRDAHHLQERCWYRGLRVPSRHGLGNEIFVDRKQLYRDHLLQDILVGQGFDLPTDRAARTQLLADLAAYKPSAECALTGRLGWHEDVYVLAFESIGPEGSQDIVFLGSAGQTRQDASRGKRARWKNTVATHASTSTLAVFAIAAAFAPVIMRFAPCESGMFHFYGLSGTGKTTIIAAAASVWRGGPSALDTWNSTSNALQELFAKRNDGLTCLDEITLAAADKRALRSVVQQVAHLTTQGKGRQRSVLFVGEAAPEPYRFLAVSTGEKAAAAIASAAGDKRMKGEEARFIDIPVPSEKSGVFDRLEKVQPGAKPLTSSEVAQALNQAVQEFYGTAGRAFVRYIVKDMKRARAKVTEYVDEFFQTMKVPSDSWEQRIAMKFALVYAAGRLAIDAGLVPWDLKLVRSAVARAYHSARDDLKTDQDRVADALARLQELVRGDDLVDLVGSKEQPAEKKILAAKALRYQHKDQVEILVSTKAFDSAGDSASRGLLLAHLEHAGILKKPMGATARSVLERTVVKGMKTRPWFYVFTEELITYEFPSRAGLGQ